MKATDLYYEAQCSCGNRQKWALGRGKKRVKYTGLKPARSIVSIFRAMHEAHGGTVSERINDPQNDAGQEAKAELARWKKEAKKQGQHIIGRVVKE